jgi:signal transduction histidine kinase
MRSSIRFLIVLLALTVALAGLLAYEAQRATRSHRVTAERALRDYAAVAGWEFVGATSEELDRALTGALGHVLGTPAASPYDSLPAAAAVAPSAGTLLRCPDGASPRHLVFAFDFRNGTLTTSAPVSADLRRWLADSVAAVDGASARTADCWGEAGIALYGVKVLRYTGVARSDVAMAAYGVVTCRAALLPVFAGVMAGRPLLPSTVVGDRHNRELVSLSVTDPFGAPVYRSGPAAGVSQAQGDTAAVGPGGVRVRAALAPSVAGHLLVASPRSRLPLLLGLLLLAAGLAAVAVRQLRREQELVRLRADFTSSVSHELRTPLTQILLFAETLELGRAGGEDARRQALGIIVQEARRLAHLVDNVLQYSRAERRLVRVRPETVVLAPLLREIVERFAPLAGAAALRLRTELDDAIVARVHPESLHQIVINLLDNAVKHGGAGPIRLATTLADGCLRLTVDDRGPGIPAAERDRVWQPFVRLGDRSPAAGSGWPLRELVAGLAAAGRRSRAGADSWSSCGAAHGWSDRDGPGRARLPERRVMARLVVENNRNLALGLRATWSSRATRPTWWRMGPPRCCAPAPACMTSSCST